MSSSSTRDFVGLDLVIGRRRRRLLMLEVGSGKGVDGKAIKAYLAVLFTLIASSSPSSEFTTDLALLVTG